MSTEWFGPAEVVIRRTLAFAPESVDEDERTTVELALSRIRLTPESLATLRAMPHRGEEMTRLMCDREQRMKLAKDYLLEMWEHGENLPSSDDLAELANSRHAELRAFALEAAQYVKDP